MSDFIVALGLVFVIEGLLFAAIPGPIKRAVENVMQTPDQILRIVGISSAAAGTILIWLIRG